MTDGLPQNILDAARTLWSFHRVDDEPAPADIIIGLGSYDLRVAGRCADLYRTGYASRILFTGGSGNWTRDVFERPEADIFADVAVDAGVPPSAILIERQASNIGENLHFRPRNAARPVIRHPCDETTDPEAHACGNTAALARHSYSRHRATDRFLRSADGRSPITMVIEEMVGDLARLIDYPARGYCAQVPISGGCPRCIQHVAWAWLHRAFAIRASSPSAEFG